MKRELKYNFFFKNVVLKRNDLQVWEDIVEEAIAPARYYIVAMSWATILVFWYNFWFQYECTSTGSELVSKDSLQRKSSSFFYI